MAYIKTDDTGRVTAASLTHHCGVGEIETDIPEGAELENIHDYKFVDGEWVYDPRPLPETGNTSRTLEHRVETLEEQNAELTEAVEMILSGVTSDE